MYLWDEDGTDIDMISDENYTIVDTSDNRSEVEIYQNHSYVIIFNLY